MAVSAVSTCPDYIFILQQRIDVVSAPAAAAPTFLFSPARNYHKRQASFLHEGLLQPPTQARLTCVARSSSCISGGCDLLEFRKVSICLSLESERILEIQEMYYSGGKSFCCAAHMRNVGEHSFCHPPSLPHERRSLWMSVSPSQPVWHMEQKPSG